MTLLHPIWLLLAIPLAAAFLAWKPATRLLQTLRIALFAAIVLAMCGLAIDFRSRAGTVVIVADRSLSMPRQTDAVEREIAGLIESKQTADSKLGIVSFGRDARVELAPGAGRFGSFTMRAAEPESNLQAGLETALSLIPPDSSGRIVVLTDGRWSGQDPTAAMLLAADRGIAVDYRLVERPAAGDLAIERIDAPSAVAPGEAFVLHSTIRSPSDQNATITLRRGDKVLVNGVQHLVPGANRVAFRDRAAGGGLLSYTLQVAAAGADPLPENNRARFLVGVNGPRPVLVVSGSETSRFPRLLAGSGIAVDAAPHPEWTLETLANHSAVVLENLPADSIGLGGMNTLASWVTAAGGGLVVTGGPASFAAGGYFKSPLEPVIPVSMELRREHRKLRMSLVIAMDRSGSMAMDAGGGRTKMDLADLSAVQVLDLLSPQDELGVIAIDSSPHIVADLDPIEGRPNLRKKIMSVESEGGGIFIYEALASAAKMLLTAHSRTRHILLFADASDSEEEGDYKTLLANCIKANITVSVIGLGTPHDSDADLLRDIARRGGGQCYFTDDPHDLPRLFAQDTFIVARSAFVDVPTPVHATPALYSLTGRTFSEVPPVGGFNLCYLREGASPAVLSADDYHAPIVASWHAGLGRVLAYTGEVDGAFTGPIGKWSDVASFDASLVRWAAGRESPLPDNMLVTQRAENGAVRIELQLDPERPTAGVVQAPEVTTLAGALGAPPLVTKSRMQWTTPDVLSVEVPLRGDLTYLSSVDVPGAGRVTLPAVCLPYSPEFAPDEGRGGRRTMERIARATGGRERVEVWEVWQDLARRRQPVSLTPWLIALAVLLLLVETLERRTRLVTVLMPHRPVIAVPPPHAQPAPAPPTPDVERGRPRPPREAGETPALRPESEGDALLDALGRAGERAKQKTR